MCFPKAPKIEPAKPPIDRQDQAAQRAYSATAQRRAAAYDEADTDVVGAVIANQNKPVVSTQIKKLMGA